MLSGRYKPGDTVIVDVNADDGELLISPQVEAGLGRHLGSVPDIVRNAEELTPYADSMGGGRRRSRVPLFFSVRTPAK